MNIFVDEKPPLISREGVGGEFSNPQGATSQGDNRVQRGGSWINNPQNCRSAYRNNNGPGVRNNNIGFRLVLASSS